MEEPDPVGLKKRSCQDDGLTDGIFHFQVDEPFELDAIFHGKFPDKIIDETIHAKTHGFPFVHSSLLHVENLLGAYFRNACLVLN